MGGACMSLATRKLHKRCEALAEQARTLLRSGQNAAAAERFQQALEIAERLAQDGSADYELALVRGTALLSLGQLHADAGHAEQALDALDDCVNVCVELNAQYQIDPRRLLAAARQALGHVKSRMGMGASAVLELDRAVNLYVDMLREARQRGDAVPQIEMEACQAFVANAEVLMVYGDPNLAVKSVEMGWQTYVHHHETPGWDEATMGQMAMIASDILARNGRLYDALWADVVAAKAVGDVAQASGSAANRRWLATVLTNRGLHLLAADKRGVLPEGDDRGDAEDAAACLARSRALDAAAVTDAIERWERVCSERPPVTLATAVGTAVATLGGDRVPADLVEVFGSPPPGTALGPSGRCDQRLARTYAPQLADVAVALLPMAAQEGLRIGLEAHYLFDIGWGANPLTRAQAREWAIPWTRLILECCKALAAEPESPTGPTLAVDLASRHVAVTEYLLPRIAGENIAAPEDPAQTAVQAELAKVSRDSLAQLAELLAGVGKDEVARVVKTVVDAIGDAY